MSDQLTAMRQGGKLLGKIKHQLVEFTKVGMSFAEIEAEAQRLIKAVGAIPNFAMVPGYHWATCVMKNDEMCHGIPTAEKIVNDGDLITIDVGLLWEGYHLDTTTSFVAGTSTPELDEFLAVGRRSLDKAIAKAVVGNSVYDISKAIEKVLIENGCDPVYQLTGHGLGKELHMEPAIPCFAQRSDKRIKLYQGQTIAVETMYAAGDAELIEDPDGWTYRTKDGSLAAMFEETVIVQKGQPEVLTS